MSDMWADGDEVNDFAMPDDEQYNPDVIAAQAVEAETASAPAEPSETPDATAERLRNERGQFVKAEPETPADEPAPEEASAEEEAASELILGKFRDHDAVVTAYQQVEQDRGRLANELGSLRAEVAALREAQQPPPQQDARPQQIDVEAARDWLDQNPTRIPEALEQAFAQGNDQLVAVTLNAWQAVDEVAAEQARIAVATARATREMQRHQEAQTREHQQINDAWNAEAAKFLEKHPDFEQHASAMQESLKENGALAELLESDNPRVRAATLEALYSLATAGRQPADNLALTAEDIARRQSLAAEQAIKDATVASATSHVAVPKDRVAELTEGWDELEDHLAPGWNISSHR